MKPSSLEFKTGAIDSIFTHSSSLSPFSYAILQSGMQEIENTVVLEIF